MRTRYKRWAVEYLATNLKNQFTIEDFKDNKFIDFISKNPTYLEIGPGKGRFIVEIAKKFPNYNFIVCELNSTISGVCLKKIDDNELTNVKLVCGNFYSLVPYLNSIKIDGMFLNFSDPWPKKRHEKRRLTSDDFLLAYANIIKNGGLIYLKTDNLDFFNYSVEQFQKFNFEENYLTYDYNQLDNFDAKTEFETKFENQGIKIKRAIFEVTDQTIKVKEIKETNQDEI